MRINNIRPNILDDEDFYNKIIRFLPTITIDSSELIYSIDRSIALPSLSATYIDLFSDFGGRPFLIDTTGYTHGVIHIYWNKNGGAGTHSLRILKQNGDILYENANLANGENLEIDFQPPTPAQFLNFAGKVRIQVKGNGADSPVFESLRLYLRR